MDIDKINDRMQEAWEIGDEILVYGLAGDLVDEVRRLQKTRGWIPVTEDLPKDNGFQLVMLEGKEDYSQGKYNSENGLWWVSGRGKVDRCNTVVTHWLLIPELPKESTR